MWVTEVAPSTFLSFPCDSLFTHLYTWVERQCEVNYAATSLDLHASTVHLIVKSILFELTRILQRWLFLRLGPCFHAAKLTPSVAPRRTEYVVRFTFQLPIWHTEYVKVLRHSVKPLAHWKQLDLAHKIHTNYGVAHGSHWAPAFKGLKKIGNSHIHK